MLRSILVALIRLYQVAISPRLPPSCRFEPSCSNYALDALERHGLLVGSRLAARRLLRCHPWGGSGYDPVPPTGPGGDASAFEPEPAQRAERALEDDRMVEAMGHR